MPSHIPRRKDVRSRHGYLGGSTALVTLSRNNLVVKVTHVHAESSPSLEVIRSGHGTTRPLVPTNRPVLVEGCSASDGGLIHLLVLVDVVDRPITGDLSLLGHAATGVVAAVVFQDVVLDQGTGSPTIDGEIGIPGRVKRSRKFDLPKVEKMSVELFEYSEQMIDTGRCQRSILCPR